MKKALTAALVALVLTALLAGAGALTARSAARAAAADRLASLPLDAARQAPADDPAALCQVYEHAMLTEGALAVDCTQAQVVPTTATVVRLDRALVKRRADQVYLGGGWRTSVCLGRTDAGWTHLGTAFDLADCALEATEDQDDVADRYEAAARALIDTVRAALGSVEDVPAICSPQPSDRSVPLVQRDFLDGRAEWGGDNSQPFVGCLGPSDLPIPCELREPVGWVAVVEELQRVDPQTVGSREYSPGRLEARLLLVDVEAGRVACADRFEAVLEDELVLGAAGVQTEWRERQREATEAALHRVSRGVLTLR